jgi:hypothetical protein
MNFDLQDEILSVVRALTSESPSQFSRVINETHRAELG